MIDSTPTPFVVCDPDGKIKRRGSCPKFAVIGQANPEWGEVSVAGDGGFDTHWVDLTDPFAPVITEKTAAQITVIGNVASNVPVPSLVYADGQVYQWADSVVEIEFQIPGTYDVTIKTLRYLPFVFTVTQA
jgi:hypothetical protein